MLDASFPVYNPAWAHGLTIGDLVRCDFPDPLDHSARVMRICAVSDIQHYHGAIFVELVPAIHENARAPEPGDISLDPVLEFRRPRFGRKGLWLRPDEAERYDVVHWDFHLKACGRTPIVGQLFGDELVALERVRARHLALREAHVADRRARRAQRRKAR